MGTVDIAFTAPHAAEVRIDGREVPFRTDAGTGYVQLPLAGEHTLSLRKGN